jgi:hypothetical protein
MENEEKAQLEAQHKEMNDMKGDTFRFTGLLEQILTSRPGEGTSTRPIVPPNLHLCKYLFSLHSIDFGAIGTLMET